MRFLLIGRTFIEGIQGYVKEGSGNGNSLHRGPLREPGGVSSTGTLSGRWRRKLEVEHLLLNEFGLLFFGSSLQRTNGLFTA